MAPGESDGLLLLASHLEIQAFGRRDKSLQGDVLVFPPGTQEMITVQQRLLEAAPGLQVRLLHSDIMSTKRDSSLISSLPRAVVSQYWQRLLQLGL